MNDIYAVSDNDAIFMWRKSFERKSFMHRFIWGSCFIDYQNYKIDMENAKNAIEEGILYHRKGDLKQISKSVNLLDNPEWRKTLNAILRDIKYLLDTYPEDYEMATNEFIKKNNDIRDNIIKRFNTILVGIGESIIRPLSMEPKDTCTCDQDALLHDSSF